VPERVELGNVPDVGMVVARCLRRQFSGIGMSWCEREELHAEGLLIMCELWARFQGGSFLGYADRWLGPRLVSAWHRMHREHRRQRDGVCGATSCRRSAGRLWRSSDRLAAHAK
jgi:hypothetical protein